MVQNCTNATMQVSSLWVARFLGAGTAIPPGCPAIDPLALPISLPPQGQGSASVGYMTFATCTATALRLTTTVSSGGVALAQQTADLAIGATPRTCTVAYRTQSEWSGGFVAGITIGNTGAAPIVNWILAFSFPGDQHVTNAWNATVTESGQAVTARAMPYHATINPGGSVSFGFQGTWPTSDAPPTAFTVNGVPCATA